MDNIFKGIEVRGNSNCKELTTIALNRFFSVSTNQSNLPLRTLGKNGGLSGMGMSDFYGPADETESLATIHAALDAGVNVLDTVPKRFGKPMQFTPGHKGSANLAWFHNWDLFCRASKR